MTMTTFIYGILISFSGLMFLIYKMHREMKGFISELEFFLKQRTIAHNQVKAKLAVLDSKYQRMKIEKEALEVDFSTTRESEADFKEQVFQKVEELTRLTEIKDDLLAKNKKLKETVLNLKENSVFGGLLAEAEFIEARNNQIKKLGAEISSIQEVLNGDFKVKLTQYLEEVDGLNKRLSQAREEYYSKVSKSSLTGMELDEAA